MRVHRLVAEAEVGAAAPVAHPRPGDHLDPDHAGVVVLGGVGIGAVAHLLDLVLRRQPAAAETVDEDLRPRPGHLRQLLGHLVGIVREALDFFRRERGGEAVVAPPGGIDLVDGDLFLDRQRQGDGHLVGAAAHGHGLDGRAERLHRRPHLVGAGGEVGRRGHAALVGGQRLLAPVGPGQHHGGARQDGGGLVQHRHAQRGGAGTILREGGRRAQHGGDDGDDERRTMTHHGFR